MKRILLDTNIYGELVIDTHLDDIKKSFETIKKELIIYGLKLVRNELRATSKLLKVKEKNLRIALISLYDYFTGEHELKLNLSELSNFAGRYYKMYRLFGGSKSKEVMLNNFMIVACASKNNLDIVVSNDDTTMLTENALRAYKSVNLILNFRTPRFIDYKEFKKIIMGGDQW